MQSEFPVRSRRLTNATPLASFLLRLSYTGYLYASSPVVWLSGIMSSDNSMIYILGTKSIAWNETAEVHNLIELTFRKGEPKINKQKT